MRRGAALPTVSDGRAAVGVQAASAKRQITVYRFQRGATTKLAMLDASVTQTGAARCSSPCMALHGHCKLLTGGCKLCCGFGCSFFNGAALADRLSLLLLVLSLDCSFRCCGSLACHLVVNSSNVDSARDTSAHRLAGPHYMRDVPRVIHHNYINPF